MNAPLTAAIANLKENGEAFGQALAHEQALERQRPLLKELAIRRIMERDKCSATAAKDIANSDLEYMNHKVAQGEAVVAHYRAEAEFEVAKAEATQASLITPSMIELNMQNESLLADRVALVRSNDLLNERLTEARMERDKAQQVGADLENANRDLSGQLATAHADNDRLTRARNEALSDLKTLRDLLEQNAKSRALIEAADKTAFSLREMIAEGA